MNTGGILSPLDGRYRSQLTALAAVCGAEAFARARVRAEIAWLLTLETLHIPEWKNFSAKEKALLARLPDLTPTDLQQLADIENKGFAGRPATRHDVKAVEYWLADQLGPARAPWIHFALTSEDINSAAYAQILSDALSQVMIPALEKVRKELASRARTYSRSVLLARTHGQPAVPTTFGRELKVFETRLARQLAQLKKQQISCKFGGAIGAYNAHVAAFPKLNWTRAARVWLAQLNKGRQLKIFLCPLSTQVDNRDSYAELFDTLRRIHIILLDFCQDMWQYVSRGLVRQKAISGEVGSSTMPQKINPIDFENAEGNLGVANALLEFFCRKLPISRLQRDLSDSTVLRNIPVALGHGFLAYQSLLRGMQKTAFDGVAARAELEAHPEVLAEAYQTILRAAGIPDAYEKLKEFTRGQRVQQADLKRFIESLNLDKKLTQQLLALTPQTYTGLAVEQAGGKHD